jgi:hypothetical protein
MLCMIAYIFNKVNVTRVATKFIDYVENCRSTLLVCQGKTEQKPQQRQATPR